MKKKFIFFTILIFLSALITLVLLSVFYSLYVVIEGAGETKEILTKATVYLFFLRLTGTLSIIFIGIATSLGALRNVIFSFYKKTAFWKIHTQWASSIGIGMASSHLTIFLLYENRLQVPLTLKLFNPNFSYFTSTSNLVFISTLALSIFTLNFILTNIPGVTGKKWWKPLHIINYFGFFLVLIHAYYIGSDSSKFLFEVLYATFLLLAVSGALHRFFVFAVKLFTKAPPPIIHPSAPSPAQQIQTPPADQTSVGSQTKKEPVVIPTPGNGMPLHDEEFHVIKPND